MRKRYDGKKRNPWNDIECGGNYARSMASFSLIPILSGFVADLSENKLTFCPRIKQRPFKSIWSVPTGWGTMELYDKKLILTLKSGYVEIKQLNLPFIETVKSVCIDEKIVEFKWCHEILSIALNKATDQVIINVEEKTGE